ncbi:unnamed protein product [Caenorhabditis sp. 36 PRJEB53466]|nr:unnamed protein product [Caenorhabditis sp. 36 PRJEB53466]
MDRRHRPHKRAQRKRLQNNYTEQIREEMNQQLERRFQNQPTSSARPSFSIEAIPLPSESVPLGHPPMISAEDYVEEDFLRDPKVTSTHSAEMILSDRTVRKAEDAERDLLSRSRTTVATIFNEFCTRILEVSREKRKSDSDSDADSTSDSSAFEHQEEPGKGEGEEKRRINQERKMKSKQEKLAEKERQVNLLKMEIDRKRAHPNGLHTDVPFNEQGLGNDGPECRCPPSIRGKALRHGYYPGEDRPISCHQSGSDSHFFYTLHVNPVPNTNQTFKTAMIAGGDEFEFEGFSLITHEALPDCMTQKPICKYGLEYGFRLIQEKVPEECFDARDCDIMYEYIFHEIFEMLDFDLRPKHVPKEVATSPVIHVMPRFVNLKNGVVNLWSTKALLAYFLIKGETEMLTEQDIERLLQLEEGNFHQQTNRIKQAIVLNATRKPSAIRADWFERDVNERQVFFIHNSIRFQTYTTASLPRISHLERRLARMRNQFQNTGLAHRDHEKVKKELEGLREENRAARTLRLCQPVEGFVDTGLRPDVVAHISMVILACHHIRYNLGLNVFEQTIGYRFNDRKVIELAFMHSSFKTNYGTPTDHIRNLISNCGYRRKYGSEERRDKKKAAGMHSLYNIMSGQVGTDPILHNERLEYLGDAVVEMIVSHHLFFMFPHHHEGGLATYRTALVQNRNLANLAMKCRIDELLQYAHGSDLCNEGDWKHALANAFEALMAAVYLDGGIAECDRIFSQAMYGDEPELKRVWDHINEHELKREDPLGDRELSYQTTMLVPFHKLEQQMGVQFNNIRLLAKAFTRRNIPFNEITKGHNQRLEWLGDSVLQLVVSDFLFRRYPFHHEGHMSLLRTSLVSNQTQAYVCDDLGFAEFVIKMPNNKSMYLKMKDKADLVEAFIGALYVDQGIESCRCFVRIAFCPRLKHFIANEKWNDSKSHLQQWCLMMRDEKNPNPQMPEYKTISMEGPTNNRVYKVAVYFRGKRLASTTASNLHKAELAVAEIALANVEKTRQRLKGNSRQNFSRVVVAGRGDWETIFQSL